MKHPITALTAAAALIGGCTDPVEPVALDGSWGGVGISLEITSDGAVMEFDCATAVMASVPVADASRRFEVGGSFTFEHGGPVREGEPPDTHPARFRGTLAGDNTLTLTIAVTDVSVVVGPFTLEKGRAPLLRKCL